MAIITNIEDLRVLHKKRTPKMFYDYADSGSWTESTYRANESDFQKIKFRQRVAVDMNNRTTKTTMVGQEVSMPVALAPTGLTGMQHADGEILAAIAAEKFGVPFCLSTMSICSIEDVAERTTKPFWFQLYVMKNRSDTLAVIKQAKDAGFEALVLRRGVGLRAAMKPRYQPPPPKVRRLADYYDGDNHWSTTVGAVHPGSNRASDYLLQSVRIANALASGLGERLRN